MKNEIAVRFLLAFLFIHAFSTARMWSARSCSSDGRQDENQSSQTFADFGVISSRTSRATEQKGVACLPFEMRSCVKGARLIDHATRSATWTPATSRESRWVGDVQDWRAGLGALRPSPLWGKPENLSILFLPNVAEQDLVDVREKLFDRRPHQLKSNFGRDILPHRLAFGVDEFSGMKLHVRANWLELTRVVKPILVSLCQLDVACRRATNCNEQMEVLNQ
jgi:hypothetical protein